MAIFHLTIPILILFLSISIILFTITQPFQCGCCIMNPWDALSPTIMNYTNHTISSTKPWKGLVFFPGHGEISGRRTDILRSSILQYNPEKWDCIIFYYAQDKPPDPWILSFQPCGVIHEPGLSYGDWMEMITPDLVNSYNYTHICVHINDVQYQTGVNPSDIVQDMEYLGLDVASPNIIGSYWSSMCKDMVPIQWYEVGWLGNTPLFTKPLSTTDKGSRVKFIEIQVTFFTSKAWSCWWEMMNPSLNPYGWNYDQCFFNFCMGPEMGILGRYTAIHWGKYPPFMGGVQSTMSSYHFNMSYKEIYRTWLVDKFLEIYGNEIEIDQLCFD